MNKCCECSKPTMFKTYSALRRHAKKFHAEKLENIAPLKRSLVNYNFTCQFCPKHFNRKCNLTFHIKKSHPSLLNVTRPGNKVDNIKKCPLCSFKNHKKSELLKHFEREHDINVCKVNVEFESFHKFIDWKNQTEKLNTSLFVMERGAVSRKSMKSYYYVCHRSGYFVSESKGKRHLKKQGSNKIDGFCPASVTVSQKEDGKCNVVFIETHVGHTNSLSHLPEPRKQSVVTKNTSKLSFTPIVDKVVNNGVTDDDIRDEQFVPYYNQEYESQMQESNIRYDAIEKYEGGVNHIDEEKEKLKMQLITILDSVRNETELETLKMFVTQIESTMFSLTKHTLPQSNGGEFSEHLKNAWLVG